MEESSGVSVLLGRRRRELGEEVDGRAALAEHLEELGLEVVLVPAEMEKGGERWVRRRWAVRRALAVSETRLRTASAG